MAIASLTVDLTVPYARFEADLGKIVQVATRETERLQRARARLVAELERESELSGKTATEVRALRGAYLGVNAEIDKFVTKLLAAEQAQQRVAAAGTGVGGAGRGGAAREASQQEIADNDRRLASLRAIGVEVAQVSRAYEAQRDSLIQQAKAGEINAEQLRAGLATAERARKEQFAALSAQFDQQKAAIETAAVERRAADERSATARRLIDQQNGLTVTYREQLRALRELRDAGAISQDQFRTAGVALVQRQPAVSARYEADEKRVAAIKAQIREVEDAEAASAARRAAVLTQLNDRVTGYTAQYRQQLELVQEAIRRGEATEAQAARARLALLSGNPVVAQIREQLVAQQAAAAEETANTERRAVAAQRLIDQQHGLTAAYREQLRALRELRDAGSISQQQFRTAGTALVREQPVVRQRAAADASDEAFVQSLQRQAEAIGKNRIELLQLEAARRGLTDRSAPFIKQLADAEANLNKFGLRSGVAKYQLLTLQYTISDVAASLASGISPFTILLQQGGQVADVFANSGGIRAFFSTIAAFVTPAKVAVAGLVTVVGGLTYALYQGAEQSKVFADAIGLSGNAAGLTESRFNDLLKSIAASGEVTISSAREIGQALISTGQIVASNFDIATEAATRFATATGKTAKEVSELFARISRDPTAAAKELQLTYNLLTVSQYEQVRSLQEQGREAEAAALIYGRLNERIKTLEPNLGTLDRTLRFIKTGWADMWNAAFDIGRTETIEARIEKARQAAEQLQTQVQRRANQSPAQAFADVFTSPKIFLRPSQFISALQGQTEEDQLKAAKQLLDILRAEKTAADDAAASQAKQADLARKGFIATDFVEKYKTAGKAVSELNKELEAAQRHFDVLREAGAPVSAEDQAAVLAGIRKRFTARGTGRDQAEQDRKALLQQDLKALDDALRKEQQALQFNDQFLNAIYSNGLVSLQAFTDERQRLFEEGIEREADTLEKRRQRLQRELNLPSLQTPDKADERIRVETELNETIAAQEALTVRAARERVLNTQQSIAQFRQLTQSVVEYRAQILQLQGDEVGAARLRAQQAIERARLLSQASQGSTSPISDADVQRYERLLEVQTQLQETQRLSASIQSAARREEELISLRSVQNGESLRETEEQIYEARRRQVTQLGELARSVAALAEVSTDPRVKEFAADLALAYAKAADQIDPGIQRLRAGVEQFGSAISRSFEDAVISGGKLKDIINSLDEQLTRIVINTVVTQPLEKSLQGLLRSATEGNGILGIFGEIVGSGSQRTPTTGDFARSDRGQAAVVATDAATAATATALAQQSVATASASSAAALQLLTQAAAQAAQALAAIAASSGGGGGGGGGGADLLSLFFGGSGFQNQFTANGIDFGSAGFPLANGTNYVPYDGFRAALHRGEAVVPRQYNPAAGGIGNPTSNEPQPDSGRSSGGRTTIQNITLNVQERGRSRATAMQEGEALFRAAQLAAARNG